MGSSSAYAARTRRNGRGPTTNNGSGVLPHSWARLLRTLQQADHHRARASTSSSICRPPHPFMLAGTWAFNRKPGGPSLAWKTCCNHGLLSCWSHIDPKAFIPISTCCILPLRPMLSSVCRIYLDDLCMSACARLLHGSGEPLHELASEMLLRQAD